jgi:hypothetical protein
MGAPARPKNTAEFNVRMPAKIRDALDKMAAKNERSRNAEVVYALKVHLGLVEGSKANG